MPVDWEEFQNESEDVSDYFSDVTINIHAAKKLMLKLAKRRLKIDIKKKGKVLRFPVAFFILRGDRGGNANEIAEEAISSINYWNLCSGDNIDILFPGWDRESDLISFDVVKFYEFQKEIEASSKWIYGGESEILLINFDYDPATTEGRFSFDESVSLPVEDMIKKGITSSVDALVNEIVSISKSVDKPSVWEISDQFAIQRARKSIWEYIKNKATGGFSKVYDELRPFAVCNLEKNS